MIRFVVSAVAKLAVDDGRHLSELVICNDRSNYERPVYLVQSSMNETKVQASSFAAEFVSGVLRSGKV